MLRHRRLGAGIAIAAMVPLLPGCGRQPDAPSDIVELTYANASSVSTDAAERKVIEDFMKKNPKIRVRRVSVAGDYYSKLMVMMAGNTAPDVMWMGSGFGEFSRRNAFLDISEIEKEIDENDYYKKVIDWYRMDGRLYGFPYGIDCVLLAYNKDIFRKAGVPFPTSDWNLDNFVAKARQLMQSPPARAQGFYAYGGSTVLDPGIFGAQLLSDDQSRCLLNSPEYIEAMQFKYDLEHRYRVSLPALSQGSEGGMDSGQAFKLGKLAMVQIATWDIPSFQRDIKGFDWDVVLPPAGKQRAVWASTSGTAIYAHTKHPRESLLLLKQLVSSQLQLQLGMGSGAMPTHRATAKRWVREMPKPPANLAAFEQAVPYLKPVPRVIGLNQIMAERQRAEDRIMMGRATPTEALNDAAKKVNTIIARQNELLFANGKKH